MDKKIFRKWAAISVAVLVITASMVTEYSRRPVEENINITAEAAIIINAGNGQVLYEKNADRRLQPASTVKVMTAIIAIKNMPLDEKIIPTESVKSIEPTNAGLEPGVAYRLKDLIAAILIKSANDAAVAIAEGVAGNEDDFARLMNQEALEFGMLDTNFTNASGLPAKPRARQYTTARDLSKMMRQAVKDKFILEKMSVKEKDIYAGDGTKIQLTTHNRSLVSG
ncbi:MAG: serine hydrolase, partial [Candidatus Omnitrophica bacterium]|nr:serine hydrolase [Candidatus Omnitrophota bacterium]